MRARRSLFVSLAKAQLFAIPRWFSRDDELPFFGMETIILCFHLSGTVLSLLQRIERELRTFSTSSSNSHSWSTRVGMPSDPGAVFDLDVFKAIRISGIVN